MNEEAVDRLLADIAQRMSARISDEVEEHLTLITRSFERFREEEALIPLLRSTVRETLAIELDHISHGTAVDDITIPPTVAEWTRRAAQREFAVTRVIRGYRLSQALFVERFLSEIGGETSDPDLLMAAARRLNERTFAINDRVFAVQIELEYGRERDKWMRERTTARRAMVVDVLARGVPDVDAAERVLGYRLRRHHVAAIVWEPSSAGASPEQVARVFARSLGCHEEILVVPIDESTVWVWIPGQYRDRELVEQAWGSASTDGGARVALGEPGRGVDGFRLSHRQASQARAVGIVSLLSEPLPVVRYADAGAVAMLCADMEGTRLWVESTLGDLARDTKANRKLRETVQTFLEVGSSYIEAGGVLGVHRNTIKYRVDQAESIRGRSFKDGRLDVELALRACRLLGAAVLRADE